ncbi:MAG TPA: hypothetical protein VFW11_07880 [Cyclobacteriaceae bacterium]|nr:hypothetical protein [Cyclobacteriaceae bacterium]
MKKLIPIYLLIILLIASNCKNNGQAGRKDEQDTLGMKAENLRKEWQKKLSSMNIRELHEQLKGESVKGLEPFNSMALKEVVSRGKSSSGELASLINENNRSSFLSLMALKEVDPEKFQTLPDSLRVQILTDALKNATTFNAFGLPHLRWEAAAKTIIEMGDAAKNNLRELLKDQRPAPVWGSEDYQEYLKFKYRVCDYAYAMLVSRGDPVSVPENPEERDKLIQALTEQK